MLSFFLTSERVMFTSLVPIHPHTCYPRIKGTYLVCLEYHTVLCLSMKNWYCSNARLKDIIALYFDTGASRIPRVMGLYGKKGSAWEALLKVGIYFCSPFLCVIHGISFLASGEHHLLFILLSQACGQYQSGIPSFDRRTFVQEFHRDLQSKIISRCVKEYIPFLPRRTYPAVDPCFLACSSNYRQKAPDQGKRHI